MEQFIVEHNFMNGSEMLLLQKLNQIEQNARVHLIGKWRTADKLYILVNAESVILLRQAALEAELAIHRLGLVLESSTLSKRH